MDNFFGTFTEYLDGLSKTILFFFVVLIVIRLLGKREVGEISVFDLVVLLMIADIAVNGIDENRIPVMFYIVCLLTLLVLQKAVAYLIMKVPPLRNIFDGKPAVIIFDGKIVMKELKKQTYTIDDLISQARFKGALCITDIKMAILEASGELSVFMKDSTNSNILPVVVSGCIVKESLEYLNLVENDIKRYIESINGNLSKINYLSSDGENYFLAKDY